MMITSISTLLLVCWRGTQAGGFALPSPALLERLTATQHATEPTICLHVHSQKGAPFTSFLLKSRTNTTSIHSSWSAGWWVHVFFFLGRNNFKGMKLELCYISQCWALHLLFRSHLSKLTHESSWTPILKLPFSSHRLLSVFLEIPTARNHTLRILCVSQSSRGKGIQVPSMLRFHDHLFVGLQQTGNC